MKTKFFTSFILAIGWISFSIWIAIPWIQEVANVLGTFIMLITIGGIAIIPGFIVFFLYTSLLLKSKIKYDIEKTINVSILIAAFNEQDNILNPLSSLEEQEVKGKVEVIVIDDGSSDMTSKLVRLWITNGSKKHSYRLITFLQNQGKSAALNQGLKMASYETIITLDADTTLGSFDSIQRLATSLEEPYVAIAGAIVARNEKKSLMTRIQEWDYTLGISLVKRTQAMYDGTLVCQGAFSAYRKDILEKIGGWKSVVGEDIVLTWDMLNAGYKTSHNPEAIALTEVPESYKQFFHQRKRWSRGLIEAFKQNWPLLFKFKMRTIFIWYNFLFPFIDAVFAFIFVPAIIGALFFEIYLLASRVTLFIIPLSIALTLIIYFIQCRDHKKVGIKPSKRFIGMLLYMFFFQLIQTPATLSGYFSEFFGLRKTWGTKLATIAVLLTLSSLTTNAQKVGLNSYLITDSDNNLSSKGLVSGHIGNDYLNFGLQGGVYYFQDKTERKNYDFVGASLDAKTKRKFSTSIYLEKVVFSNSNTWRPWLYDANAVLDSIGPFRFEILSSKSILDVAKASNMSILSNGGSLDCSIGKHITLVGGYINQRFSDENQRNIYTAKVIETTKIVNIALEGKWRKTDTNSSFYFSPKNFDTYSISMYRSFGIFNNEFLIKPKIGAGIQHISNDIYSIDIDLKNLKDTDYPAIYQTTKNYFKVTTPYYFGGIYIGGNIGKKVKISSNLWYSSAINNYGNYGLFFSDLKISIIF